MISSLASRTFLPLYFSTVVKRPAASTGERIGKSLALSGSEVVLAVAGAVWTRPVPVSIVT